MVGTPGSFTDFERLQRLHMLHKGIVVLHQQGAGTPTRRSLMLLPELVAAGMGDFRWPTGWLKQRIAATGEEW